MNKAMNYENLIRRVYQCGRYGVEGADADLYRRLLCDYALYRSEPNNNNDERKSNLGYEYRVSMNKVWNYLQEALLKGNSRYSDILTEKEKEAISNLIKSPKNLDIAYLDSLIDTAEEIYVNHNIYPK